MAWILVRKEIKSNYKILLIFLAILSIYCSMIVAMYDPKLGESLNMMAESMPHLFAAFGMMNPGLTLLDFISNYLYGFILIVIPLIFIILMCYRLLIRYEEQGSMVYLLTSSYSRVQIVLSQWVTIVIELLVIVIYVMLLIILCCHGLYEEALDISQFLMMNIGLFSLLFFLLSLCYLSACCFHEMKYSLGVGAGLSLLFILIQMLSQVSDKICFLKYLTPLSLFDVKGLMHFNEVSMVEMNVLFILGLILCCIGCFVFKRRNVSI